MIEVHPEIHASETTQHEKICTCHQCHHSFRARSEDQFCLQLCNECFTAHMNLREPVISVHVKARPRRPVVR
jgi:hypothetical protein